MAEVSLENVVKVFPNGVRALDRLDLIVPDGERLVIVGPSGSGKSTALRLIAGLESVSSGTIRIAGRLVNQVPPRDRDVALVFQRPSLYPHLRVRGNLEFGLKLRQRRSLAGRLFNRWLRPQVDREDQKQAADRRQRVEEAARLLELTDVMDRLPRQLSGGQQQRVALGRALVRRPAVFLLDEPLSNLDPRLRTDLRRELHLLQRRLQATMIYVTHDQTEALSFGERVVVLDQGVVQQIDAPQALYDRPRNRFVASFIGSPPMNLVPGTVLLRDGCLAFQGSGGSLALPDDLPIAKKVTERRVLLGIRPEDLVLDRQPDAPCVTMEVSLLEPLGGETLVTCRRDDWQVTVRSGPRTTAAIGQKIEVGFPMSRAHWFDAETGLALTG